MKNELINLLSSYLYCWKTLKDCSEWLASVNWDNLNIDVETIDLIGRVELILTEVIEGERPQSEFVDLAKEIVVKGTDTYIISQDTSCTNVNSTSDRLFDYSTVPMVV